MNESLWKIIKALRTARAAHGIMLLTDPPQDAWKKWGVSNDLVEAERLCEEILAYTQPYQPIYSPPIVNKWVGLTGKEVGTLCQETAGQCYKPDLIRMVEKVLEEKNNGN